MQSPKGVVPVLIDLFHPKSVVDFGCGIGNFLAVFQQNGVRDVTGLDGAWVDRALLKKHIDPKHFRAVDFTLPVDLDRRFDLAISFEVAEHLPPECAAGFVASLTAASDIIVFSAAFPFQGGQNHLNEQWPEYWAQYFAKHGYDRHDLVRPLLWAADGVQLWYRQNTFVYAKRGTSLPAAAGFPANFGAAHPDMYFEKARELEWLHRGKAPFWTYLKLLGKSVLRKIGVYKR